MTRWLTEAEQRTWRAFLHATKLLFETIDADLQHDSALAHGYYEILVGLSEAPGRSLRMSELAERTRSSRSRLSHAVTRLEDEGWVRRESCPNDRRGLLAVLTDEGMQVLVEAAPSHVERVRAHLFDQLSPDQVRALGEISTALIAHLEMVAPPRLADACPD